MPLEMPIFQVSIKKLAFPLANLLKYLCMVSNKKGETSSNFGLYAFSIVMPTDLLQNVNLQISIHNIKSMSVNPM